VFRNAAASWFLHFEGVLHLLHGIKLTLDGLTTVVCILHWQTRWHATVHDSVWSRLSQQGGGVWLPGLWRGSEKGSLVLRFWKSVSTQFAEGHCVAVCFVGAMRTLMLNSNSFIAWVIV